MHTPTNSPAFTPSTTPLATGRRVQLLTDITVLDTPVPRGSVGTVAFAWPGAAAVTIPGVFGCPTIPVRQLAPAPADEVIASGTAVEVRDVTGTPRSGVVRSVDGRGRGARVVVACGDDIIRCARRDVTPRAGAGSATPHRPVPVTAYVSQATYDAFAVGCAARGLSMSAVAVTWMLWEAQAVGHHIASSEWPGAARLAGDRSIGSAARRAALPERIGVTVYLYGREAELLATLAASTRRSRSNLLEHIILEGIAGAWPWPMLA